MSSSPFLMAANMCLPWNNIHTMCLNSYKYNGNSSKCYIVGVIASAACRYIFLNPPALQVGPFVYNTLCSRATVLTELTSGIPP